MLYMRGSLRKPTEMNDLGKCIEKTVRDERYRFGLSPLHSYMRFFEYFLHSSYRLDQKAWQIGTHEGKQMLLKRKQQIQSDFRKLMGLIVDKPKAGGSGTSNDGNTTRKFSEHPHESAKITGLDKTLIIRCSTIL